MAFKVGIASKTAKKEKGHNHPDMYEQEVPGLKAYLYGMAESNMRKKGVILEAERKLELFRKAANQ